MSPSASPSLSPSISPSASPSEEVYNVVIPSGDYPIRGVYLVKWTGFTLTGDTGAPCACPNYPEKSIQVVGTFGGATVTIQGSNIVDSPIYSTLNDDGGTALTFTEAGIKKIRENSYWVRPSISGTTATTNLNVHLLSQK